MPGYECDDYNTINIAMFPFIPDAGGDNFHSLSDNLEAWFHRIHPDQCVKLDFSKVDDIYTPEKICGWLNDSTFDLVAIDSVLLSKVAEKCKLLPWEDMDTSDWYLAAKEASTIDNQIYGVPHYLCGHFIFTMDEIVIDRGNKSGLLPNTDCYNEGKPEVVNSGMMGSYGVAALYVNAGYSTYNEEFWSMLKDKKIDETVMDKVVSFFQRCSENKDDEVYNSCLSADLHEQVTKFVGKQAKSFAGFFESLFNIEQEAARTNAIDVKYRPLAVTSESITPLFFTDIFVKGSNCKDKCVEIAQNFAKFYTKSEVLNYVMLSKDVKSENRTYRYLIPATLSGLYSPEVVEDLHYAGLVSVMKDVRALPSLELLESKAVIKAGFFESLKKLGISK